MHQEWKYMTDKSLERGEMDKQDSKLMRKQNSLLSSASAAGT